MVRGFCAMAAMVGGVFGAWLTTQGAEPVVVVPDARARLIDHVVLASERVGVLKLIDVQEGDQIQVGVTVAALFDDVVRAQLALAKHLAESDVKVRDGHKAREEASEEYAAVLDAISREPKSVPKTELTKRRLAVDRAAFLIEQAEVELKQEQLKYEQVKAELETYAIRAPFSGMVTRVFKSRGEAVQQGDPLLELVNSSRMKVEGYVPLEEARKLKVGMPVTASAVDEPTAGTLTGKIVFIDAAIEPVSRKVRVWAEVANPEGLLLAGQQTTLHILPAGQSPAPSAGRP